MISFKNDYSEGAHPAILQALVDTNNKQQAGYGEDEYSLQAAQLIQQKMNNPRAAVHLVSGGTQANLVFISSVLRPYESVIAATSGHINVHETGAIEATGHKVETVECMDGKVTPADVASIVDVNDPIHMTLPRMVYISNSTELGTHYLKQELVALWNYCKSKNLYLYMDGARLASGLQAGDITFEDLALYTDAFYIGGTKNGALIGEAIVINNPALQENFAFHLKMRGALLAKGRLLGIQFIELFKEDRYMAIGAHMNNMAAILTAGIQQAGFSFFTTSTTNQIFPILPDTVIDTLREKYAFYTWKKLGNGSSAVRLVTSWATTEEMVQLFLNDLPVMTRS
ncbi:L-threonine aldolase [Filimonas lacunae]|uniref:L-threonine aldolase n=1 Tax=Filimonas lacunae TaxID=477680 RepID=A0A173MD04_9BACT|nr:beta-eliminating lyase-related protein [Filimonas lacunae]BAV05462.1 low-specificity L-threonine aldolase [Filimonas lacunae]SIT20988.1 L-threonine aldolase [Filimonas lacunae]